MGYKRKDKITYTIRIFSKNSVKHLKKEKMGALSLTRRVGLLHKGVAQNAHAKVYGLKEGQNNRGFDPCSAFPPLSLRRSTPQHSKINLCGHEILLVVGQNIWQSPV